MKHSTAPMKDFLEGRSTATSNRPSPKIPVASNLPSLSSFQEVSIAPDPLFMESEPEQTYEETPPLEPETAPVVHAIEPQVELVHDAEGRISHILVTCRCGEKTTLQCSY